MFTLPTMAVNAAILAGGSVYLYWLFPTAFAIIAASILLGVGGYRLVVTRGYRFIRLAREQQDALFGQLRALTDGIKELKLHRERREAFLEEKIQTTTEALQRYNYTAAKHFILGHSWSQIFLFGAIGWILFVLPGTKGGSPEALTGYLLTFVYLIGPLGNLLNLLPGLGRANIALQKVESLGISLESLAAEPVVPSPMEHAASWRSLELRGVTHSYHREKEDSHFMLGPIDLAFQPGELVFLIGGNGSGKSTLAKVLTGLYAPEAGQILLDGQPVTDENRDAFRQNFSVVFSDFYLFESLLGLTGGDGDTRAKNYLARLHLEHKVTVKDGVLSTTALSQGQRKRLALLTAFLEDRPFYVFDEWASDQDPVFKEIFYREILQELKARGRTVLVITHDDRFTSEADRLFKMEEGKLYPVQDNAQRLKDHEIGILTS
jgi:putative ATP-binding cassette transporter